MKSRTKKILIAILFGSIFLNSGFLFAKNHTEIHYDNHTKIFLSDKNSEERKKEFWDKFRESVKPREKNPPEAEKPREVNPREVHPREIETNESE